jgi:glutamyl-tRNA synthetase
MILGPDKKKLSKRHGATAVSQYREDGYLNEALFNYLVRLSWSHGDDEIFTREKLIEIFSIENINKSSAVLNMDKLNWLNAHYIKTMSVEGIIERLITEGIAGEDERERLSQVDIRQLLPMSQQRAKKLFDVYEGLQFLLNQDIVINETIRAKYLKEDLKPVVGELVSELDKLSDLNDTKAIEDIFKAMIEKHSIKMKPLAQAVRVLLTGSDVSPGIFEVLSLMKRDMVFKRLRGG